MVKKIKKAIKLLKKGELLHFLNIKYNKIFLIKNNIIKNTQLKDEVYRKMKKKYSYVLEGFKSTEIKKSNKVWVCWLQGEENAPELVKKCIQSTRENIGDREFILITNENYRNYIEFPDYILEKFEKKIIPYAQFSDLIRISLLAKYGGLWVDATVLCTNKIPNYILDAPLFVYKEMQLDRTDEAPVVASNWLISAYANSNIIIATQRLLFEYWKNEKILNNYFIFHLFFKIATEKFEKEWKEVPAYSNIPPHTLQFELLDDFNAERYEQIKDISPIHKLNRVTVNEDKSRFTFYDYIISNDKERKA